MTTDEDQKFDIWKIAQRFYNSYHAHRFPDDSPAGDPWTDLEHVDRKAVIDAFRSAVIPALVGMIGGKDDAAEPTRAVHDPEPTVTYQAAGGLCYICLGRPRTAGSLICMSCSKKEEQ